jgi:hypothetical protein
MIACRPPPSDETGHDATKEGESMVPTYIST